MEYVVYFASIGDEVLYIGCGKRGREKHCTSGASHCPELNRIVLSGGKLDVSIVQTFKNKQDALAIESMYIQELQPKFNKKKNVFKNANLEKYLIVQKQKLIEKKFISLFSEGSQLKEGIRELLLYLYDNLDFEQIARGFRTRYLSKYNDLFKTVFSNRTLDRQTKSIIKSRDVLLLIFEKTGHGTYKLRHDFYKNENLFGAKELHYTNIEKEGASYVVNVGKIKKYGIPTLEQAVRIRNDMLKQNIEN